MHSKAVSVISTRLTVADRYKQRQRTNRCDFQSQKYATAAFAALLQERLYIFLIF